MLINKRANVPHPEFTDYLRKRFPGLKMQKISLNAGFTCPNRDGNRGYGGCTYCNNRTFNPDYCENRKSITEQLREGIRFFSRKYPEMKYLAYFQAYTNTYDTIERLRLKYEEALNHRNVAGIIIGTRPDCVSDRLLDYLRELSGSAFVMIEYGIESTLNETLKRINRGHTYEVAEDAVRRTSQRGLPTGAHLILGLPGETRLQIVQHAVRLSTLPLTSVKLHQLQLIRGTVMGREYERHPEHFRLYSVDEYLDLVVEFIEHLRTDIHLDRFVSQSPPELLLAPAWGLKNHEFRSRLARKLATLPSR
jgi:radical SAM protein (TIGR01212 family)